MDIRYFRSAAEFRRWLQKHGATATEVWVGFYRKDSDKSGISYADALDQALCFGWIDGIRKKVDADSYTNRFTPRKAKSTWSRVNIKRVEELKQLGLIATSGLAAFDRRDEKRSGIYSFEQRPESFGAAYERRFKADKTAWDFFQAQPPGYRRLSTWWVISAVKEETRLRRLEALIRDSAAGKRRE